MAKFKTKDIKKEPTYCKRNFRIRIINAEAEKHIE